MKKVYIILAIILAFAISLNIFLSFNYKNMKSGNNKSIEEIEKYILNIKTYKANLTANIINNRNDNTYKISQEVTKNYEKQN